MPSKVKNTAEKEHKQGNEPSSTDVPNGEAGKKLMKVFWDLANIKPDVRVQAGKTLVELLKDAQSKHDDEGMCPDVQYSVKRLARGLASGRQGARQGFSSALCQLIIDFPVVDVQQVLQLIKKACKVSKSARAQEIRDSHFGKVFGLGVLLRTPVVLQKEGESDSRKRDIEFLTTVLELLVEQCTAKSYLHAPCCAILVHAIEQLSKDVLQKVSDAIKLDSEKVQIQRAKQAKDGDDEEAEVADLTDSVKTRVAVWNIVAMLTIARVHGDKLAKQIFPQIFKTFGPKSLSKSKTQESLGKLCCDFDGQHPVWTVLVSSCDSESIPSLFTHAVESSMFSAEKATLARKQAGLRLLPLFLKNVAVDKVEQILSQPILSIIITQTSKKTNNLHEPAKEACQKIVSVAEELGDEGCTAIVKAIGSNGSPNFDALTKTKSVEGILSKLSENGIENYCDGLFNQFVEAFESEDSDERDEMQSWVLNQLLNLIRNHQIKHTEKWVMKASTFLFAFAFFLPHSGSSSSIGIPLPAKQTELSSTVQKLCATRFFAAVAEMSFVGPYDAVEGRHMEGMDKDGQLRIATLMNAAINLINADDVEMAVDLTEENISILKELIQASEKAHKKSRLKRRTTPSKSQAAVGTSSPDVARAFEILFLQVALQTFQDPEGVAAAAEDLLVCAEKFISPAAKKRKSTKKVKNVEDDDSDEEPDPTAVIVDVLLSLLAKSSSLLRTVVDHVFKVVSPFMNAEALTIMMEVLKDGNEGEGGDENDDEDDVEMEVDNTGNADLSGDEATDDNDGSDADQEDADEENSDDGLEDSDFEVEDDNEPINHELKEKLKEMMQIGSDVEGEEDDDGDDSDWDDEKMLAVDEAIASHFATASSKAKEEEKRAKLHFKLRVLDLFDIFIKHQSSNALVLQVILPLLESYQQHMSDRRSNNVLLERLSGLIKKKLATSKSHPRTPEMDVEFAHELVESTFKLAISAKDNTLAEMASSSCFFVLKCLQTSTPLEAIEPKTPSKSKKKSKKSATNTTAPTSQLGCVRSNEVMKMFIEPLVELATKRNSHVRAKFYSDCYMKFPALGFLSLEGLITSVSDACNEFRRFAVIAILVQLFQHKNVASEMKSSISPHVEAMARVLETCLEDLADEKSQNVKTKHARNLLKLTQLFVKFAETDLQDKSKLIEALRNVLSSPAGSKSPPVRTMSIQILRVLGGDVPSQADMHKIRLELTERRKRKHGDDDDKGELEAPAKVKSKKNGDKKGKQTEKQNKRRKVENGSVDDEKSAETGKPNKKLAEGKRRKRKGSSTEPESESTTAKAKATENGNTPKTKKRKRVRKRKSTDGQSQES